MIKPLSTMQCLFLVLLLGFVSTQVSGFASPAQYSRVVSSTDSFVLNASGDDTSVGVGLTESDQAVIGAVGTAGALLTFYSEYTLKTTGCGLPAGPFGLLGLAEGLSYLGVVGIGGFSLFTKVKTVSGTNQSTMNKSLVVV